MSTADIGGGYHLYGVGEDNYICKIKDPKYCEIIICGEIVSIEKNPDFFLFYRIAYPETRGYGNDWDLWDKQKGENMRQYWIIDRRNDKVYGPLIYSKYLDLRNELNIPPNLKLDTTVTE